MKGYRSDRQGFMQGMNKKEKYLDYLRRVFMLTLETELSITGQSDFSSKLEIIKELQTAKEAVERARTLISKAVME